MSSFFEKYIKRPPVVFPLVALFHIVLFGYTVYIDADIMFSTPIWIQVLWMFLYTFSWIFVWGLKRWALYTYVALTLCSIIVRLTVDDSFYHSSLFLTDIIFSMLGLAYIKRFS